MHTIVVVMNSRSEAQEISKEFGIYLQHQLNENWLKPGAFTSGSQGVYWTDLRFNDFISVRLRATRMMRDVPNQVNVLHFILQQKRTVEDIKAELRLLYARINRTRRIVLDAVMKQYPAFEYEIDDKQLIYARFVYESGKYPIDLDFPDYAKLDDYAERLGWDKFLKEKYPFINIAIFNDECSVYMNEHGSISASYSFPRKELVKEIEERPILTLLNDAGAELHSDQNNRFCTQCWSVFPKEEFGAFLFADSRCKNCADEAFKKAAREETYN